MSETLNPTRSRSTLSDVARMAGVSASTVSLVLAGKAGKRRISEDTHRRVHHAAKALGYTPSLLHRSMRQGRTHVLSFYNAFRNRERGDLYMDRLSVGVEHAGGQRGYDVLVHCNFARSVQETYEFLNGGLADGLILFGPPADDPLLPLLRASGLPTVVINPRAPETVLSTVRSDPEADMAIVAEALAAHRHRSVAAVVPEWPGPSDPLGRAARLRDRLAERGVAMSEDRIVGAEADAATTLAKALALEPRPTALFVWHDRMAYALVEACEALGVRVPEDLSVVGHDGLVWPSTSPHVVSSVQVPLDAMADAAVSLLHRLVEGEPGPLAQTLPVRFLPGTTLGPASPSIGIQSRKSS